MRFGGVPFEVLERHAAGTVRLGLSFEQLLSDSMIEVRFGDNRDVVSPVQHLLFCLNAVLSTEDAAHALARRGVSRSYPDIGVRMFLGCSTLEGAIEALARLYASSASPVRIRLETEGDLAILSVHIDAPDHREGALIEEMYLVWLFMQILLFLGRPPPLGGMTLRDPLHFNQGRRHCGVGAPVSHGVATAFWFPRQLLGRAPASRAGENVMWDCYQLWFDFLQDTPTAPGLTAYVHDGAFVRFSDLVRGASVSPNTLRRQYRSAGGTFRQMRQRTLIDAVVSRLQTSHETVESIAADLGYSDGRSLRRFLKQAAGLTPREVRARARVEIAQANPQIFERIKALGARMSA